MTLVKWFCSDETFPFSNDPDEQRMMMEEAKMWVHHFPNQQNFLVCATMSDKAFWLLKPWKAKTLTDRREKLLNYFRFSTQILIESMLTFGHSLDTCSQCERNKKKVWDKTKERFRTICITLSPSLLVF